MKSWFFRIIKAIGFTISVLGLSVALYYLAAYLGSEFPVEAEDSQEKEITVYILSNGIHTDIVVPVKNDMMDWSQKVQFAHTRLPDPAKQFVAFGWGDRGFYLETPTWDDLKASTAFKAGFGLGKTAIHATFYHPLKENSHCVKLQLSRVQYQRLIVYIKDSFEEGADGHFVNIGEHARYGYSDAFYAAKGSYSLFTTCNTWTNSALKACGQRACAWTPFDTGILKLYSGQ